MPLVHLKTPRLEYKFEILGKYTLIKGDSGTGKTTFYDLISIMRRSPKLVQNVSGTKIIPVTNNFEEFNIDKFSGCVLVIDEKCTLLKQHDAASIFKNSNNYFIIIHRSKRLAYLPIHVDNVFKIKTSGKFHTLEKVYTRFNVTMLSNVDTIITEDSKSGYLFIKELFKDLLLNDKVKIEPAYGNEIERKNSKKAGASKISRTLEYYINAGSKNIVVIYDASAFAFYIDELLEVIRIYKNKVNICVIDWDSFEGYVLASKVFNKVYSLKDTNYTVESLEQFLTEKLKECLPLYSKHNLCKCLSKSRCLDCKEVIDCSYKSYSYEDLVYDSVESLYNSIISQITNNNKLLVGEMSLFKSNT